MTYSNSSVGPYVTGFTSDTIGRVGSGDNANGTYVFSAIIINNNNGDIWISPHGGNNFNNFNYNNTSIGVNNATVSSTSFLYYLPYASRSPTYVMLQ